MVVGESKRRRLLLGAAIWLAAFLLVAALVLWGSVERWDRWLLLRAEALGTGARSLAEIPTTLGSAKVLVPFVAALVLWAYARGRRAGAVVLAGSALLAQAFSLLLKFLFGRERPDWFAEELPLTPAFPSGHAMVPTVVYLMAAWLIGSLHPKWGRSALIAAALLALASGLSRIVLGVHWPTDVVGGFAAGLSLSCLGRIALDLAESRDRRDC